jgi:hypothetical protein
MPRAPVLPFAAALACAPPDPPAPPPAAPAWTRADAIESTDAGLYLLGPGPARTLLAAEPGRHLRRDGHLLYYFAAATPTLRVLDLDGGHPRTVLELPPIDHPSFAAGDPLRYLPGEPQLDLAAGALCLDLADRPDAPTAVYNARIDLTAGTHERRLVLSTAGDQCGVLREAERPRLCTPAGPDVPGRLALR